MQVKEVITPKETTYLPCLVGPLQKAARHLCIGEKSTQLTQALTSERDLLASTVRVELYGLSLDYLLIIHTGLFTITDVRGDFDRK